MAFNLTITPRAQSHVVEAVLYYESKQNGLGDRFFSEVLAVYAKLRTGPQHYSFVAAKRTTNMRDVKLDNFPYLVVYEIIADMVTVYAVINWHKKPARIHK